MQTALFYVIALLILAMSLFQWRRAWQIFDGISRDLIKAMWGAWRVSYKSWMIGCLFIANGMLFLAIFVLHRLGINFPKELLLCGLIVTSATLSWNLLPPIVLFLGNSREESGLIATEIQGFLLSKGLRIGYLLVPAVAATVGGLGYENNFRTRNNLQWETAVLAFMRFVPIIVIDVRVPSAGITRETDLIFKSHLAHKTIFIVESDGRSEILERMFPSRRDRSFLLLCSATRVLEPLAMLVGNIFIGMKRLKWER